MKIVHSHVIDDMVEVTEKIEEEGPQHLLPDLYQFIAMSYSAKHQSNDALMYYHESLEIKRELLGEIHLDIADIHGDVGVTYHQLGDEDEAFRHMTQSLEIRQIVTGKNSFGVALSYDLASVHNKRGEYEQAYQLTREALHTVLNICGENSFYTGVAYQKMY